MTKKFKFDVGDSVFVLFDNRVQEGLVKTIGYRKNYNKDKFEECISYGVEVESRINDKSVVNFYETACFKTKKELLESL